MEGERIFETGGAARRNSARTTHHAVSIDLRAWKDGRRERDSARRGADLCILTRKNVGPYMDAQRRTAETALRD